MRHAALAMSLLAGACGVSVDVPRDALISCGADGDCPLGYHCRAEDDLCVPAEEQAPPASGPYLLLPAEQTRLKNGDTVLVVGAVSAGARVASAAWIDVESGRIFESVEPGAFDVEPDGHIDASLVPAALEHGALAALEVVAARGTVTSSPAESRSQAIAVDLEAPAAPVASGLRLIEESPAPLDPDAVGRLANRFLLAGAAGSVEPDAAVRIDDLAGAEVTTAAASAAGGLATVALPANTDGAFFLTAIDGAGNASAGTRVDVPHLTVASVSPAHPLRRGRQRERDDVRIEVSALDALAAPPLVTIDGFAASFVERAGDAYVYSFVPSGQETEGRAVLRVSGEDGRGSYAPGTRGTSASVVELDFTPPSIDAARVICTPGPAGTDDLVAIEPGGLSDAVSPSEELTVELTRMLPTESNYGEPTVYLVASGAADAGGGFGPVPIGDDLNEQVLVVVTDVAGNATAPLAIANDRTGPRIQDLATDPPGVAPAGTIAVRFTVTDANDLASAPQATVGGRTAVLASGSTATAGGAPVSFELNADLSGLSGAVEVLVSATDVWGNTTRERAVVTVDATPPAVHLDAPVAGTWNGLPGMAGGAADPGGRVDRVDVLLRRASDGASWNGSAFAPGDTWLRADGTASFAFDTRAVSFAAAAAYDLQARAVDAAGGTGVSAVVHVTYAASAQPAPASVSAQAAGPRSITVSWSTASGSPDHYVLRYRPAGDTAAGDAAEGASPLVVPGTSVTLTDLPRGVFAITVSAADATGHESAWAGPALAASRALDFVTASRPDAWLGRFARLETGRLLAIDYAGLLRRSDDRGATWPLATSLDVPPLSALATAGPRAIAVGSTGTLLCSEDSGDSWREVALGLPYDLFAATATAEQLVAVGDLGEVVHGTCDGSWDSDFLLTPEFSTSTYFGLYHLAADGQRIVAIGSDQGVLISGDGGHSWQATVLALPGYQELQDTAVSGDVVVIVSSSSAVVSSDGGATFTEVAELPEAWQGHGVHVDGDTVLLFGLGIYRSVDRGRTFALVPGTDDRDYAFGYALADGPVIAITHAVLWRSANGGATFTPMADVGLAYPEEHQYGTYIAGDGAHVLELDTRPVLRVSDNGGATWHPAAAPVAPVYTRALWSHGNTLVASASLTADTPSDRIFVGRSTDGGASWRPLEVAAEPMTYVFAGSTLVAGSYSAVLVSRDEGADFASHTGPGIEGEFWQSIATDGAGTWIVAGYYNRRLVSGDDGATFSTGSFPGDLSIHPRAALYLGDRFLVPFDDGDNGRTGAWVSTDGTAWSEAFGADGAMESSCVWQDGQTVVAFTGAPEEGVRSLDGGQIFTPVALSGLGWPCYSAVSATAGFFAVVGSDVFQSADSGDTWTQVELPPLPGYPQRMDFVAAGGRIFFSRNSVYDPEPSDGYGQYATPAPQHFVSEDGGATWIQLTGTTPRNNRSPLLGAADAGGGAVWLFDRVGALLFYGPGDP